MEHPQCPECDEEIDNLLDAELEHVGIVDGCEWEMSVVGYCPECEIPLGIYGSSPQTYVRTKEIAVSPKEKKREAYEYGYEHGPQLNAQGDLHGDSMPKARAIAGNSDDGPGTYTRSEEIHVMIFEGTDREEVKLIESDTLVDGIARAMAAGARDALEDKEPRPDLII